MPITASQLYNHLTCPHRVSMDVFGDVTKREPPIAFVEMLWERGSQFESETIRGLGVPFTDVSALAGDDKEEATRAAMTRGEALIYGGRLSMDNLLGEPDLLRRVSIDAAGVARYVAIDIKSGAGELGGDDDDDINAPKKHYAVQLALYTDILIRMGVEAGRYAFVLDIHGAEIRYDFDVPLGKRNTTSLWELYLDTRRQVGDALERAGVTQPAAGAVCKLCVWRSACLGELKAANDLTLLPELGRSRRDALSQEFANLEELAGANIERYISGTKTTFPGIGPDTLRKFQARAQLARQTAPQAYLKQRLELPVADVELYFDIETDPMRDVCYLHGFVIRHGRDTGTESFVGIFAEGVDAVAERDAFARAIALLRQYPQAVVYIYSKYERTIYRKLAAKYPEVCSSEEIEALFQAPRTIDLYGDVVRPHTEWPTMDFSIKSIAKYLGFQWRDSHPSGAASIEWFQRYIETQDAGLKQRILDYNEDDCIAMRVLVDALGKMPVHGPA